MRVEIETNWEWSTPGRATRIAKKILLVKDVLSRVEENVIKDHIPETFKVYSTRQRNSQNENIWRENDHYTS
jgi:hypothetical protein